MDIYHISIYPYISPHISPHIAHDFVTEKGFCIRAFIGALGNPSGVRLSGKGAARVLLGTRSVERGFVFGGPLSSDLFLEDRATYAARRNRAASIGFEYCSFVLTVF